MAAKWQEEFGADFEIPGFLDYLTKECHFIKDESWHNDACPCFAIIDEDGNGVRLWVEHPIDSMREHPEGNGRFLITNEVGGNHEGAETDVNTDDLEEALEHFIGRAVEKGLYDPENGEWQDLYQEYIRSLKR